jgi:hypothetical protein
VSRLAVGPWPAADFPALLVHAGDEKGARMSEEQFPDEEPDAVQDGIFTGQSRGAASSLESGPVAGEPDTHPGVAENNPGGGRDEPLLRDDTVSGEEEDFLSEQTPGDDTRHGTDVPTLEEAAAETDPGGAPTGIEPGPSDDQANLGGSPLSRFDPEDLDR